MPETRILVVEDDADIRESFQQLLEDEGYATFTADNGATGLSALGRIPPPCVVLLDLFMPELDGLGFMQRLGETHPEHARRSRVVLMTAASPTDPGFIEAAGLVSAVLRKPPSVDSILAEVERAAAALDA